MNTVPTTNITAAADDQEFYSVPRTPEQLREQLADLCLQVELLRSWFGKHEKQIYAAGDMAASRVYDCFIDAVCLSRSLASQAGIQLDQDYLKNYDWHPAPATPPAPEVGPAPALHYTGGTLGLNDDEPEIMVKALDGVYQLTLEQALRNIDQFAEPGRTRLLLAAGVHYGVAMVGQA